MENKSIQSLEEKIKKYEKLISHLKSELGKYKYIFEKMPGYVYWKNTKSEYMGCNENLAKFSNLEKTSDIAGMTDDSFSWGEDVSDKFQADDQKVMRTEQPLVTEYELPEKRPDGHFLYVRTDKMPFYDKSGKIIGILAIAIDITDQKLLEKELLESRAREERLKVLSSMGGMIAHELRTPLAGMGSGIRRLTKDLQQLISTYKEWSEETNQTPIRLSRLKRDEEICQYIQDSLSQINSTIDTILVGFKPNKVSDEKLEVIQYDALVSQFLDQYPLAGDDKARISVTPAPLIRFRSNREVMLHVLTNLLKNAFYYIQAAGRGDVTISAKQVDKVVKLSVRDTATGIAPDVIEHIFEPFFTTKSAATSIGMGLYFCKMALENVGGSLACDSVLGEYAEFIITLPYEPIAD